ncbi:hypothetical protein ACFLWE_01390 [Chloroflexota bacterium]
MDNESKIIQEKDDPRLYRIVAELVKVARLSMPKIGISALNIPNAFAFGRSQSDAKD